jgi:hypothetical protein
MTFSEIHPGQKEAADNIFDTDETVKQIKAHDLTYERICNGGKNLVAEH